MFKIVKASEKDHLEIIGDSESRFYGDNFNKLIGFPDRKRFKDNRFIFLNCSLNVKYALETFPEMNWKDCEDVIEDYFRRVDQEKINSISKKEDFKIEACDFQFKTKPFQHQLKAFMISKDLEEYALLFEQRTGKTKCILDNSAYLFQKDKIDSLIVIAPNGVHRDWINEAIPEHLACDYKAFIWSGDWNKKEENKFNEVFKNEEKKLKIYSFNIDCFVSEKRQEMLKQILEQRKCLLVVDESHKIKNPSAKRTKFLISVAKLAKYRRILTGTPIANGAYDLYSQFYFLNPKIIGLTSFFAFRNRYCLLGGFENRQIIGYRNLEELQDKIDKYSLRVVKKECFDLPPKIRQKIRFDLTTAQRKMYNDIKEEGLAFIKDRNLEDPLIFEQALTRVIKMQQITSGFIYDTENKKCIKIIEDKDNPKLQELLELLDRIESKAIIWTKFVEDINILSDFLKEKAVRYDGQISNDQKEFNKKEFKTNPNIKYIIINSQVGAEGLTLPEAGCAIYYTNGYSYLNRAQSEDRNHDINTKESVTYFDLCANNTIDNKIRKVLIDKKKFSEVMLNDPRAIFDDKE